jgi:hypothetical protein
MPIKSHRDHGAQAAMLAYRTGLSAASCKGWLVSLVAKSAEDVNGSFDSDNDHYLVDDTSINIIRSEIEAFALARLKAQSTRTMFQRPGAGGMPSLSRHRAAPSPANASHLG